MDDRFRHRSPKAAIPLLGIAALFAALWLRADLKALSRMLGFWAYLAATGRQWPDGELLRAAQASCPDDEALVPYWGSLRRPDDGPSVPGPDRVAERV